LGVDAAWPGCKVFEMIWLRIVSDSFNKKNLKLEYPVVDGLLNVSNFCKCLAIRVTQYPFSRLTGSNGNS